MGEWCASNLSIWRAFRP